MIQLNVVGVTYERESLLLAAPQNRQRVFVRAGHTKAGRLDLILFTFQSVLLRSLHAAIFAQEECHD